ncbi:MAG: hypothetical protein P8X82_18375 [Gemmatimonadales bacterium]
MKFIFHDPALDGLPCWVRELKLNGSVRFSLDDEGPFVDPAADANVPNAQGHEIATAQFAVGRQVEQGQIAHAPLDL